MKYFIGSILAFLLAIVLLSACQSSNSPSTAAPRAPLEFTFKDLSGEDIALSSLRGNVVLLNFWASWCSPCREEMPLLESFYRAHQNDNFILVAVNVSESAEEARDYIEEHNYTFRVWSDPPGNSMIKFGINGLPASIILDAEGRRNFIWIGPFTQEYLDELVLPLIQGE